jgi:hypothetical protein
VKEKYLKESGNGIPFGTLVIKHENFTPEELERGIMNTFKGIYNPESNKRRATYFRGIFEDLVQI